MCRLPFHRNGGIIFSEIAEKRKEETMEKIQMTTPLVEMDGDEMTRVLWQQIKDELLLPFIDLKTEYYDLGLPHREETGDQVTVDSAEATKIGRAHV